MTASAGGENALRWGRISIPVFLALSLVASMGVSRPALAESPMQVGTLEPPPPAASSPPPLTFVPPPAPSIDSLPPAILEHPQTASSQAIAIAWSDTAQSFGDEDRRVVRCPPGGAAGAISGTDLYTDDSSICSAAVHAGRFTLESGGDVTVEMRPGQMAFAGSSRYGLTSLRRGQWQRSFIFVEPESQERMVRVAGVALAGDCTAPTDSLVAALAQSCDGKDRCTFSGTNGALEDLTPSCTQQALVLWQCGAKSAVAIAEPDASGGLTVTLACDDADAAPDE
jgi:hypothetical protein